ncbi:hypothetical protein [Sphingopyxis sp.]|jgi:hypothetical protein|uniref:hypothetical protein n=1 Tax=Sphingopyxis sp. TaxID=1908224 RepID=UPI003F7026A6
MDKELRILKRVDLPAAALGDLDNRVIGALAVCRREAAVTHRLMTLAAFVSLGGGVVAGSVLPGSAAAASPLSPFGPVSALAPSTLLDAG